MFTGEWMEGEQLRIPSRHWFRVLRSTVIHGVAYHALYEFLLREDSWFPDGEVITKK